MYVMFEIWELYKYALTKELSFKSSFIALSVFFLHFVYLRLF